MEANLLLLTLNHQMKAYRQESIENQQKSYDIQREVFTSQWEVTKI